MEMEDILGKLRCRFPDHKFECCKPPQYLSTYFQQDEDLILCYNVKSAEIQFNTISNEKISVESSSTGNPLEVPYSMDESILSLTLCNQATVCDISPLTSAHSLKVKNYCNLKLKPQQPVVVLCYGDSGKSTFRILQHVHKTNNWICHSWIDYYTSASTNPTSLNELLRIHSHKISGPNSQKVRNKVQLSCQSVRCSLQDVTNNKLTCCNFSALFKWSELTVKPPEDSATSVFLIVDIHMDRSSCLSLTRIWKQLVLLQTYVLQLENHCSKPSLDLHFPKVVMEEFGLEHSITENTVSSRIKEMVCEFKRFGNEMPFKASKQSKTLSQAVEYFSKPKRRALELTDILWLNLIGCDTYQTLEDCFKELFKCTGSSSTVKPMKTNISRLAHFLHSNMFIPKCVDPLELLVEIGIEKLRKELLSIFDSIQISLASLDMPSLPRFIELNSGENWFEVTKDWLTCLARLYSSLNVLLCIDNLLHTPPLPLFFPVIQCVVSKLCANNSTEAVDTLTKLINYPECSITLPVSMDLLKIYSDLDTESFDEWSLTLRSECEFRKVTSVFSRSNNCKIPYIIVDDSPKGIDATDITLLNATCSDASYVLHCLDYHSISDSFF